MGCWSQSVEFPGSSQPVSGLQGGLSQLPIHKTFWPLTRVVTLELLTINNLFASLLNGAFITESHMDFSAMPPIPRTAALLKENSAYNGICQSQRPGTFHSLKIYLLFYFWWFFFSFLLDLLKKNGYQNTQFYYRTENPFSFRSVLDSWSSIRCQSLSVMTRDGKYTKRHLVTCRSVETMPLFLKRIHSLACTLSG